MGKAWSRSAEIYSWQSSLAQGSTRLTNYLMFFFYKAFCVRSGEDATMPRFWKHVRWSLWRLYQGTWPDADVDGRPFQPGTASHARQLTPLAGGFRAALWVIKGDLDWIASDLGLPWHNSSQPCALCLANDRDTPWTDCRQNIHAWADTMWDNASWAEAHPHPHALFTLPGVGILAWVPDTLHTKHLGTDAYLYGSVLDYLVSYVLEGSREDNLATIWSSIKTFYRANGTKTQFQNMKLTMFQNPGKFPRLKGRGAEIRHLGPALLHVFCEHMVADNRQHRQIKLALELNVRIESIFDDFALEYALPPHASASLLEACYGVTCLVTLLGRHFHEQGVFLFNFTIKSHYLLHIGLISKYMSPRLGWCYKGEDFMQVMKRIIAASCRGTSPAQITTKVMRKYVQGLHIAFRPDQDPFMHRG